MLMFMYEKAGATLASIDHDDSVRHSKSLEDILLTRNCPTTIGGE